MKSNEMFDFAWTEKIDISPKTLTLNFSERGRLFLELREAVDFGMHEKLIQDRSSRCEDNSDQSIV
jgi:hypothetical protein